MMKVWVFNKEQLEAALATHFGNAQDDQRAAGDAQIVREFLDSEAARQAKLAMEVRS